MERQKLDFPVLRAHPEDALICKEYRRMWNVPPRNRYNGGKISLAGFKPVPLPLTTPYSNREDLGISVNSTH
jgi:hypothetical protein